MPPPQTPKALPPPEINEEAIVARALAVLRPEFEKMLPEKLATKDIAAVVQKELEGNEYAKTADLKRTSDEIKSTILSMQKNKTDISDFEKLNSSYVKLNMKLEDANEQVQGIANRLHNLEKINWQP